MTERGKFIVIEGSEFSGKSTQLQLLRAHMGRRGINAVFTREPGGTPFGNLMRKTLFFPPEKISPEVEMQLFTADRLHNYQTVVEPALSSGQHVISDRNWYSTLCYQGASEQVSADYIETVTRAVLPETYIKPDIAFVLTIPPTERAHRKASTALQDGDEEDSFEAREAAYHERVDRLYRDRVIGSLGGIGLDGCKAPEIIHAEIISNLDQVLATTGSS